MKVGDIVKVKYPTFVKNGIIYKRYEERNNVLFCVLWSDGSISPTVREEVLEVICEGR